jgi:hypothetical protein
MFGSVGWSNVSVIFTKLVLALLKRERPLQAFLGRVGFAYEVLVPERNKSRMIPKTLVHGQKQLPVL